MLEKVFQEITNKRKFFASSSTGEQFENQFRNELKKHFSEINGDLTEELSHIEEKPNKEIKTTFNQLKKQVLEKTTNTPLKTLFQTLQAIFYTSLLAHKITLIFWFLFLIMWWGLKSSFLKTIRVKKTFKLLAPCGIQTCLNPMRFMCMESLMQTSLFLKAQIF
ncbi:hypothetical protein HpCOL178_00210 [Helicobacter pylori]